MYVTDTYCTLHWRQTTHLLEEPTVSRYVSLQHTIMQSPKQFTITSLRFTLAQFDSIHFTHFSFHTSMMMVCWVYCFVDEIWNDVEVLRMNGWMLTFTLFAKGMKANADNVRIDRWICFLSKSKQKGWKLWWRCQLYLLLLLFLLLCAF